MTSYFKQPALGAQRSAWMTEEEGGKEGECAARDGKGGGEVVEVDVEEAGSPLTGGEGEGEGGKKRRMKVEQEKDGCVQRKKREGGEVTGLGAAFQRHTGAFHEVSQVGRRAGSRRAG
ncbi:hypothetical protein NSK_005509 [Nannochloropsis salina CCMP1776]|uniref:Uncharacterized protein n=1 Tax=Nannochloropsis salina CCMP1776 TaxID=1027361 RepID=A0A4D9CXE3_9STRA|nr:hypothetical protein NSK_005509 [Nannochloropsis salina CCMP1776]|eukprot:TFJ83174.1 hypothetical protein NSK_005509 [Nannochloropsis salina CCMP1776]